MRVQVVLFTNQNACSKCPQAEFQVAGLAELTEMDRAVQASASFALLL